MQVDGAPVGAGPQASRYWPGSSGHGERRASFSQQRTDQDGRSGALPVAYGRAGRWVKRRGRRPGCRTSWRRRVHGLGTSMPSTLRIVTALAHVSVRGTKRAFRRVMPNGGCRAAQYWPGNARWWGRFDALGSGSEPPTLDSAPEAGFCSTDRNLPQTPELRPTSCPRSASPKPNRGFRSRSIRWMQA
jgi:hypothetical protein